MALLRLFAIAAVAAVLLPPQALARDVFTSSASVYEAVSLQATMAQRIREYVTEQIDALKELDAVASELEVVTLPESDLTLRPSDGFGAIRRLSSALSAVRAAQKPFEDFEEWVDERKGYIPDDTDVAGSADSLLRLQRTYNVAPVKLLPNASVDELYFVGKQAYKQEDYYLAKQWLTAALKAHSAVSTAPPSSDLLDHLAFSCYKTGHIDQAITFSKTVLETDQDSLKRSRVATNVMYYERLKNESSTPREIVEHPNYSSDNLLKHPAKTMENFRRLCRGQPKMDNPPDLSREVCEVLRFPEMPFHPINIEHILSGRQDVKVFRDFFSPEEGEHIVEFGKSKLRRAVAFNGAEQTATEFRISSTAWLDWDSTPIVERVHRRMGVATGLDIHTAELLQLSNYGIGGHYEPHQDWGKSLHDDFAEDRLATFMMYLSDVSEGGGTVFPILGAGVMPRRGDAIFWFDLLADGEGDTDTLHGGCPVLAGSKWVANKWFHLRGSHKYFCKKNEWRHVPMSE